MTARSDSTAESGEQEEQSGVALQRNRQGEVPVEALLPPVQTAGEAPMAKTPVG